MKSKLTVFLALIALVPFALAACGGDDEDEGDTANTTTQEETAPAGDEAGGGEATRLEFTADPGGALEFEEESAETQTGPNELTLVNESQVPHDVVIESPDAEDVGGTDVITNDTTTASVEIPEPGDYTFYCSVPGHREAGMEGPLTVK